MCLKCAYYVLNMCWSTPNACEHFRIDDFRLWNFVKSSFQTKEIMFQVFQA